MRVKIEKSRAVGRVVPPASKSMAHRLLIAAALAEGRTKVVDITPCEDVLATVDCLRELGVSSLIYGSIAEICGGNIKSAMPKGVLDCRESGSTLRFMLPLALLSGNEATFIGAQRLMERPMSVYEDICRERGLLFERGDGKITVQDALGIMRMAVKGE